jgi:hypothetical protein
VSPTCRHSLLPKSFRSLIKDCITNLNRKMYFNIGFCRCKPQPFPLNFLYNMMKPICSNGICINLKNAVFWDVALCRSCVNRRFGGSYRLHLQCRNNPPTRNQLEQVTADCSLKMEAIRSSETSVHTRSTQRHIPDDGILHSHRCENLKSYIQH